MPFTHPVPDWNAQGVEPPESLKTNGWQVGQKPPADFFNWYFYNSAKALIELQLNAVHQDEISGLVQDASTTQKGVVQLSNSTTSTSEVLAATPKAVKTVDDKVGPLESLITDNKTNLVGAMNEVTQGFYETYWNVGDIANLNTFAKGSVVSAVNEVNGKVGILSDRTTAVEDKVDDLKMVKSNKDSEGIYTTLTYRRKSDDSLFATSVLSGGTSPNYTTRTVTYYEPDGTTVRETLTYTLTYDADGSLVSEV
ncbi:hypothetical protein A6395_13390 [Exiguobacterium sp. SH31]|uniref:phage tail protein n=1 Tax=Exiguobacterium sp. SH31 TaxID=1843183 RepID=UPI0008C08534|nr:phage tail protein [Exiguobacterium sp. SH31]OGX78210.1 hypothetical protein A6395_13390 [Exiguobacterium sp. SH31]